MSRTTYQIGAMLSSEFPGKAIEYLSNYAVSGIDAVETCMVGVMVRYEVSDQKVSWCYI